MQFPTHKLSIVIETVGNFPPHLIYVAMDQVPTLSKCIEWGISPWIYVMTIYHTCKGGHVCLNMGIEDLVSPHMLALQLTFEKLINFGENFWQEFLEAFFVIFNKFLILLEKIINHM